MFLALAAAINWQAPIATPPPDSSGSAFELRVLSITEHRLKVLELVPYTMIVRCMLVTVWTLYKYIASCCNPVSAVVQLALVSRL
ncbi:hypothetical protein F5878DRAFT_608520 [Lentinula raphanica]|uniref:Uncharacterized protein n=1 Tax=Lentinula raphanica TaxID=153919 RepID=A0AA38UIF3_9AGAR|nr:hypothetical protein F5880DRAFT_1524396 [Lentinula raphanica]KAJ3842131.1 hypothetical protein F5878DRAFT_608520 [Lentinula raphanica]